MVMFDRSMKLPLTMEERNDENDSETFGSIDLVDQNGLFVGTITAEDEENRDEQNIIDTRKDAVFILNAVNSFDEMMLLVKNYQKLLLKDDPKSKELTKIDNLINSFKTIDYDNGIPYNWSDIDI
jgi:ATP adenylyltransferase/5',5'''-P-1,P-4-tetraphosphate phosphorylase II